VTRYSLTSSLNLTTRDETGLKRLDAEGAEGKFVTAEGIAFDLAFLLLSISCFLGL
jgi:hypothetical protein